MFTYLKTLTRNILQVPKFSKLIRCTSSHVNKMGDHVNQDYYVWIDLEMTGLDENIHEIIEVACIVTNDQLDVLGDGVHLVVHQPQEVFDKANEWARNKHAESGLMSQSLNSKLSVAEADKIVTDYVKNVTNYELNKGNYYLSGNSVYMDKRFLEKYMKNVNEILHYRLIDVTTVKILCSHWYPEAFNALPQKALRHRALSDIMESINEINVYRKYFFKSSQ